MRVSNVRVLFIFTKKLRNQDRWTKNQNGIIKEESGGSKTVDKQEINKTYWKKQTNRNKIQCRWVKR